MCNFFKERNSELTNLHSLEIASFKPSEVLRKIKIRVSATEHLDNSWIKLRLLKLKIMVNTSKIIIIS